LFSENEAGKNLVRKIHEGRSDTAIINVDTFGLHAGRSGFYGSIPSRGLGIFPFTTASRTALWPTQPTIQWVPGALSLEVKWPECEAVHSPPRSAKVKERVELYLHPPNMSS